MMRDKEEILEQYLQLKSLVALKHQLSASDEEHDEAGLTIDLSNIDIIDKMLHPSWQEIHRDCKANTQPEHQYDTGVMMGKLEILEWILGGEDE